MLIWSNTTTLDGLVDDLSFTKDKSRAEVALVGGKAIPLEELPELRGIFKCGVGRDNVPESECAKRGIACGFPSPATADIIYEETASFACHLVLKCLYAEIGNVEQWKKLDRPSLADRQLLVIGTGNIGRRVATKLGAFLRVSTFDIATNRAEELEPLMRAADCITLHIPLTETTRALIDDTRLGWMKDGAALVNTARGPIVVEDALYRELKSERLRAAFDVFWQEPYRGKLSELPPDRFIMSPHVASTCREFISATANDFRTFLRNLKTQNAK